MKFISKNVPSVVIPGMLDSDLGFMTYNDQIYSYNNNTNQIEEYIPVNQAVPITTPIVMQSTINVDATLPSIDADLLLTPSASSIPTTVAVDVAQTQSANQVEVQPIAINEPITEVKSTEVKNEPIISNKKLYISLGILALITATALIYKNKN